MMFKRNTLIVMFGTLSIAGGILTGLLSIIVPVVLAAALVICLVLVTTFWICARKANQIEAQMRGIQRYRA
jgi:hypothetical protein